ncbi:hypothetical protein [Herbiconiux liukaitaii]|uniref:hypothetical protein n=1 Tax=Herbiconiux liukaitaii TaxID=3342799 RepID=UPI0035B8A32B
MRVRRILLAHEGLTALVVGVLVAAVGLLRIPRADLGVVWAEDGAVFLTQRLADGPFATWFAPYDGYLHVLPRVLADLVVSVLPLSWAGVGISVGTCLVAGLVGAAVYVCSRDVVPALPARFALAGIVVLVPTASFEVLGNLANLHWLLLWLTPWLLLARPRTRTGGVLLGVLALVVGLSDIQAAVVLPFVLLPLLSATGWRGWAGQRGWAGWAVPAALLLAAAVQVVAALTSDRAPRPAVLPDAWSTVLGFAVNSVMMPFLGQFHTARLVLLTGGLVVLPVLLAALAALAVVLWRGGRARALAALLLSWCAVVLWTAGYVVNPNPSFFYAGFGQEQWEGLGPLRYGVVPGMCVLALVILALTTLVHPARSVLGRATLGSAALGRPALDHPALAGVLESAASPSRGSAGGRAFRWAGLGMAVVVVGLIAWQVAGTAGSSLRTSGPDWASTVETGEQQCAALDAGTEVTLPVHPLGWTAVIPCDTLTGG